MFKNTILTLAMLTVTALNPVNAQTNIDEYRMFGDDNRIYWSYDITDRKEHNLNDWNQYNEHFNKWVKEMEKLNTETLSFKSLLNVVKMSPACYYITDSRIYPPRAHLYRLTIDKSEELHMKSRALEAPFATLVKYEILDVANTNEYKRIFNLMTVCGAALNANGISIFNN